MDLINANITALNALAGKVRVCQNIALCHGRLSMSCMTCLYEFYKVNLRLFQDKFWQILCKVSPAGGPMSAAMAVAAAKLTPSPSSDAGGGGGDAGSPPAASGGKDAR